MSNVRDNLEVLRPEHRVVANTLLVGNVPVNAQNIGAHDHESYYVLDLLLNNTSTLQPAIHSTYGARPFTPTTALRPNSGHRLSRGLAG